MNKPKSESATSIEAHLAALYGRINYERQDRVTPRHFKLRNMREILGRLGNPHLEYPVIHVAGTKGKGSVSTMVGEILTASGRRTGVYTSPHLETIHQRMVVDGNLITDQQLAETLTSLGPVIEAMDREADELGHRHLTFFEITTAAAFQFFAMQNCDAVVLEVGLGGRLDSTNVCEPTTCIITNISLDHTRQLGSTVDKIAFEKAGIIKPGVPVVSGATHPDAANVIAAVAADNNSSLFVLDRDFFLTEDSTEPAANDATRLFNCSGNLDSKSLPDATDNAKPQASQHQYEIDNLKLRIIGEHQRTNAAIAVAAIQTLSARGWKISDQSIRTGLARAALSGRTEIVSQNPTIVIDMAHNVASINALVCALKDDLPQWKTAKKRVLILATSRDKDIAGMLQPLVSSFDQVVLTRYQDNPRGKSELEMLEVATQIQAELRRSSLPAAELSTEATPDAAWQCVRKNQDSGDLICISGSAFLVAELRKTVMDSIGD